MKITKVVLDRDDYYIGSFGGGTHSEFGGEGWEIEERGQWIQVKRTRDKACVLIHASHCVLSIAPEEPKEIKEPAKKNKG